MTYNISEVKRHFVISGTSLYPFRYNLVITRVYCMCQWIGSVDD